MAMKRVLTRQLMKNLMKQSSQKSQRKLVLKQKIPRKYQKQIFLMMKITRRYLNYQRKMMSPTPTVQNSHILTGLNNRTLTVRQQFLMVKKRQETPKIMIKNPITQIF